MFAMHPPEGMGIGCGLWRREMITRCYRLPFMPPSKATSPLVPLQLE